ncbi:transposase [Francisella philomiragia]|nr:transposase [Francisella philomiragia]AJI47896.1 transposase IS200 like family protein [Francisella philomiragia]AJI49981.1 transposase IS200 like family protein [Francisella philomiragia]MBK2020872.1 transposase [Francisella philomiragia]MBK2030657.1 transposase [Francisella philomiragia]MBK2264889.1 transposase [Francisella philomiragia]
MTNQNNQTQYFKNRKNLRLKYYDYSSNGAYFVTICVNNRECLFGDIIDGQMCLNDAGLMIDEIYHDLENKFANIQCGEYVIMPNHFHCVIHICNDGYRMNERANIEFAPTKVPVGVESISTRVSLSQIIQTFKRQTTIEYINGVKTKNWQSFDKRLWQRNYYEHIIRNEKSYNEIIKYIQLNPLKWELDELNPKFENKNAIKDK